MTSGEQQAPCPRWVAGPVAPEVERSLRALGGQPDVQYMAVMPDVHLSTEVCVGVVLATRERIYPAAVGSDIGCGMAAIRLDAQGELLRHEGRAARLLLALPQVVPIIRHGGPTAPARLPDELRRFSLRGGRLERLKAREGLAQFGTLGRGNHFVEFQRDEQERLWLMVHSGSRAMGPAIQQHHLGGARPRPGEGLPWLHADSEAGRAYLAHARWAVRYAWLSRQHMVRRICELVEELFGVSAHRESLVQCQHNHVQREHHLGQELWVHRKGALEASDGVEGMIPGAMGRPSYHVTGRGHEPALRSSSHGAGRSESRAATRRRVSVRGLLREADGLLFDRRKARALREEAPSAYKEIEQVMRAQRALTRIRRKLWPILVYKGG